MSPRTPEPEYVLFLQGIPPHCRWQELKDFVRESALHIRQASVYEDDVCRRSTGVGHIIIKNEAEAWDTFERVAAEGWHGSPLTVTLSVMDPTPKNTGEKLTTIAGPVKSHSRHDISFPVPPFSNPASGRGFLPPDMSPGMQVGPGIVPRMGMCMSMMGETPELRPAASTMRPSGPLMPPSPPMKPDYMQIPPLMDSVSSPSSMPNCYYNNNNNNSYAYPAPVGPPFRSGTYQMPFYCPQSQVQAYTGPPPQVYPYWHAQHSSHPFLGTGVGIGVGFSPAASPNLYPHPANEPSYRGHGDYASVANTNADVNADANCSVQSYAWNMHWWPCYYYYPNSYAVGNYNYNCDYSYGGYDFGCSDAAGYYGNIYQLPQPQPQLPQLGNQQSGQNMSKGLPPQLTEKRPDHNDETGMQEVQQDASKAPMQIQKHPAQPEPYYHRYQQKHPQPPNPVTYTPPSSRRASEVSQSSQLTHTTQLTGTGQLTPATQTSQGDETNQTNLVSRPNRATSRVATSHSGRGHRRSQSQTSSHSRTSIQGGQFQAAPHRQHCRNRTNTRSRSRSYNQNYGPFSLPSATRRHSQSHHHLGRGRNGNDGSAPRTYRSEENSPSPSFGRRRRGIKVEVKTEAEVEVEVSIDANDMDSGANGQRPARSQEAHAPGRAAPAPAPAIKGTTHPPPPNQTQVRQAQSGTPVTAAASMTLLPSEQRETGGESYIQQQSQAKVIGRGRGQGQGQEQGQRASSTGAQLQYIARTTSTTPTIHQQAYRMRQALESPHLPESLRLPGQPFSLTARAAQGAGIRLVPHNTT